MTATTLNTNWTEAQRGFWMLGRTGLHASVCIESCCRQQFWQIFLKEFRNFRFSISLKKMSSQKNFVAKMDLLFVRNGNLCKGMYESGNNCPTKQWINRHRISVPWVMYKFLVRLYASLPESQYNGISELLLIFQPIKQLYIFWFLKCFIL